MFLVAEGTNSFIDYPHLIHYESMNQYINQSINQFSSWRSSTLTKCLPGIKACAMILFTTVISLLLSSVVSCCFPSSPSFVSTGEGEFGLYIEAAFRIHLTSSASSNIIFFLYVSSNKLVS
eukprot:946605_1